jgi:hypothetical protein
MVRALSFDSRDHSYSTPLQIYRNTEVKVVAEVYPQPHPSETQRQREAEQVAAVRSITDTEDYSNWADTDVENTEAITVLSTDIVEAHSDNGVQANPNHSGTETATTDTATYSAVTKMSLPKNVKDKGARKALADCQGADPNKVLHIYGSLNKKNPISFDTFQAINRKLAALIFATMNDNSLGRVSCGRPFYENQGGFVVYPCSDEHSLKWIKANIRQIDIDGQKFRAWGPTEEPETTSYTTWLADAYTDCAFTLDNLKKSITHNNPTAPTDFAVTNIKNFPEKNGRMVLVEAGPDFTLYLQNKSFTLDYFLGNLEFRPALEARPNPRPRNTLPGNKDKQGRSGAQPDPRRPETTRREQENRRDRSPDDRDDKNPDTNRRDKNPHEWQKVQSRKRKRSKATDRRTDRNYKTWAEKSGHKDSKKSKSSKPQPEPAGRKPQPKNPKPRSRSRSQSGSGSSSSSSSSDSDPDGNDTSERDNRGDSSDDY